MGARSLIIEEKLRTFSPGVASPSDFRARESGSIDARVVLQDPNFSLYCLDFENREALFVETPPEADLSLAPFFYQAQYVSARRLVRMPYETLHTLAAEAPFDPSRLVLIYSVGRCGSTLVSRAFGEVDGVDSISEPDVFTQMRGLWGSGEVVNLENAQLLDDCMRLQCTPGRIRGATAWAVKFRSMVTGLGDLFHAVYPEAKLVFLYRHAEPWGRSFLRLMRSPDPSAQTSAADWRRLFGLLDPRLDSRESASILERLACMWLSGMEKCLEMQRRGIPIFIARYEELNSTPRDVLMAMFSYCGFSAQELGSLDAVLAQDSQAGSPLARESLKEMPFQATQEHLDELRRLIAHFSTGPLSDTILPGTYFPESSSVNEPVTAPAGGSEGRL